MLCMKQLSYLTVTVSGQVQLKQSSQDEPVQITVSVHGLRPPGLHGFHLHRDGNTANNCTAAGPHFNPFNVIFLSYLSVKILVSVRATSFQITIYLRHN
jgi:Cu/Zn superoxide dismutase